MPANDFHYCDCLSSERPGSEEMQSSTDESRAVVRSVTIISEAGVSSLPSVNETSSSNTTRHPQPERENNYLPYNEGEQSH